jgi:hypothetical protein
VTTGEGERIARIEDLPRYEARILRMVEATPYGALLFLADPPRFLHEHGFHVEEGFREQLAKAAPGWRDRARAYDEILAGKALACRHDVRLRSLAIPAQGVD